MNAQALQRHLPLGCRGADVALLGVSVNLMVLVATPILRPDLNLLEKSLSYYAIGPWGIVQAVAFVAMGVASMALCPAFRRGGLTSRWINLTVAMLATSGFASLGLIVYPMGAPGPTTPLGDAHQTAGTIGGVTQLVAALAFVLAIRGNQSWNPMLVPALAAFVIALAGATASQIAIWWPDFGIPMGATMRLFVIPLVVLWGLVALRLRRFCFRTIRSAAVRSRRPYSYQPD